VRSRCPYCGARRIGRGKYTEDADNSKGKMLISVLVLGCLVVAAGVLLFTTDIDDAGAAPPAIEDSSEGGLLSNNPEDDVDTLGGLNRPPRPGEDDYYDDDPDDLGFATIEEPPPQVHSVALLHNNRRNPDFTAPVGFRITYTVRVEPIGVDAEIQWVAENRHPDQDPVFAVSPNIEGTEAVLTMLSPGTAYLRVTVGDQSDVVIVRVSR